MIRLILAELNRLRSRRFVQLAMIVTVLVMAAFQLITNDALAGPSDQEVQQGQTYFQQAHDEWAGQHDTFLQQCTDAGYPEDQCESQYAQSEPKAEQYVVPQASFAEMAPFAVTVGVYLGALVLFLVGASFIGAEYTTGSLANWLTFIPQRWKVFTSKLVAVVAGGVVLMAGLLALVVGSTALLATIHGQPVEGFGDSLAMAGRSLILGAVLPLVGFCLALLTRHTAAAIGVLLGYLLLSFVRTIASQSVPWMQKITPWTPEANINTVLNNGHTYSVNTPVQSAQGVSYDTVEHTISMTQGGLYWAAVALLFVAVSLWVFERRDVT